MSYSSVPSISKSKINEAANLIARGKVKSGITSSEDIEDALDTVNAWRVAHTYPLNTFKVNLRGKVRHLKDPIVAQRLKRMPTILDKLNREPTMEYTNMQDIGGVRAILNSNKEVKEIVKKYKDSRNHILVNEKDYITNPRHADGYRSHHLIYKYDNHLKIAEQYNGLRIEVQLRTKLQHIWATAVETMGAILGQQLKSRQGEEAWLEFFAVVSSAFAHIEKSPLVPKYAHLSKKETFQLVKEKEAELNAIEKLLSFSTAMRHVYNDEGRVGRPKSGYVLLKLNMEDRSITIIPYKKEEAERASFAYEQLENEAQSNPMLDSVLVSVGPLDELKKAYPNYFLDVRGFIGELMKIKDTASKIKQ
jgi:putative GTP pyrophosphokinase